jgi:hypothetical protein
MKRQQPVLITTDFLESWKADRQERAGQGFKVRVSLTSLPQAEKAGNALLPVPFLVSTCTAESCQSPCLPSAGVPSHTQRVRGVESASRAISECKKKTVNL